jgi:hypothetical protein
MRGLIFGFVFIHFCVISEGQSIGLNFVNHVSKNRETGYAPGIGGYIKDEINDSFGAMLSVNKCSKYSEKPDIDYVLDYNRFTTRLDLNYTLWNAGRNWFKPGLSVSYENEKLTQSGMAANWVNTFSNGAVGVGVPLLYSYNSIFGSRFNFDFIITPAYLFSLYSSGNDYQDNEGNTNNDIYIDLSLGISYKVY